jgi:hypothetical protein
MSGKRPPDDPALIFIAVPLSKHENSLQMRAIYAPSGYHI